MNFFMNLTSKKAVKPKHIARRIGRLMDSLKTESVIKTYAPCCFQVFLAEEDWTHLEPFYSSMVQDLVVFIQRHASKHNYYLLSEPEISFDIKADLLQGNFFVEPLSRNEDQTVNQINTMVFNKTELTEIRQIPGGRDKIEPSPILEVLEGNDLGMKYDLAGQIITLGRREDNQVMINDPNVSRYHAKISYDKEWKIEDLKSTNGLFVNGKKTKRRTLRPGDEIKMGSTLLKFRIE